MQGVSSYTLPMQRPKLPEYRPHPYHVSDISFANSAYEPEDDQPTPRPSLTPLGVLAEAAAEQRAQSLLRDDTATDVSDLSSSSESSNRKQSLVEFLKAEEELLHNSLSQEEAMEAVRANRRPRRSVFTLPSHATSCSAVGVSSPTHTASNFAAEAKQTASLGRRFSRKYKERLQEFREAAHQYAPQLATAGRSRRMTVESCAPCSCPESSTTPQLAQLAPPTSPSKRNGKYNDDRPKKHRAGLLALAQADRKDTPAPSSFATQTPKPVLPTGFAVNGGEAARRAAASRKHLPPPPFYEHACESQDTLDEGAQDITIRRSYGSLGSAADSGADLSTYASSCKDSDGDILMTTSLAPEQRGGEKEKKKRPSAIDFIKQLPDEINLQIFELLDANDLREAQHVSRKWCTMANQSSVWRSAFLRRWGREVHTDPASIQVGGPGIGVPGKPKQKWQRMYEARVELEKNWRRGARDAGKATYLAGHTDSVYCVQFDEEKIITGSRDRTIRVWDMNTMQCLRVIGGPNVKPVPGPNPLRTVDYPSFHNAVASVNGNAYGNSIFQVPTQWHDASILCLQYDDKILVTGSSDSDLLVWDIHTYEPIRRLRKHSGGVLDVALDAKHIVSCSKDSRIIVWDRDTYEVKGTLAGHRGPVNAVQLRGNMLVSASGDGIARLWDIEKMKLVQEFSAKERGLAAVEFSEDVKYVLAGGNDHVTYKFEVETGKEVMQFLGHSQLVRSLWLDSANKRVVSGSYDLDLRVYDFETGVEIWRAEEWTTSWMLAAKSDYRRIVATSQDGRILVIDFGLKKGGKNDGMPIDDVDLLRAIPLEESSAIVFRNPFEKGS